MISSEKILAAVRHNWWLNGVGLLLSFAASVVLVRTIPKPLFAEYIGVLAMIEVATLLFEVGANSGLTRYLNEAGGLNARGYFYLQMRRRRWIAAAVCALALMAVGPLYARSTQFSSLETQPWLFAMIAAIVASNLTRLLAHYGLLALFETKPALLLQQCFLVLRSLLLVTIVLAGGTLPELLAALLAVAAVEAMVVNRRLWKVISSERSPLPPSFVTRAQKFGLLTIFDKACAMVGSGTVLLLVLAPNHPGATLALFALAVDLVGKIVSLTVMPMGNLVGPYLSRTSDDRQAQATAVAHVVKMSSLLYCFSIGAAVLLLPFFVPAIYGTGYARAAFLTSLLLVPMAFENWIRGCCSPALLRNGRYRELLRVNVVQLVVTLATIAVVFRQPIETVLIAVGTARSAVAALNLIAVRSLLSAGTYRVPLQAVAVSLLAVGAACAGGTFLRDSLATRAALELLLFTAGFYAGLRWVIFRDEQTLQLAYRVTGKAARPLTWLLPTPPLAQV